MTAQGLIDTTEMYLRAIFELEEEGVTPLRTRIAERLGQTGPTVSQTVGEAQEKMRAAMTEAGEAMTTFASVDGVPVVIRRIGEQIRSDLVLMHKLSRAGIQPGREVILMAVGDGVCVTAGGSMDASSAELAGPVAAHIFVSESSRYHPAVPEPAAGA